MKKQMLLGLVVVGCLALLSSGAFGQTTTITGKVLAVTSSMITVESGKDVWEITRGPTTVIKGDAKVGARVTVTCNESDAQKKEAPDAQKKEDG